MTRCVGPVARECRRPFSAGEGATIPYDQQLPEQAGRLGVEARPVAAEACQQHWREANREVLADANIFLARHGLWCDGKRQF
jgi:post-segregation antitoxin (ccd killing protein)